jgi:iron complex transport system permease protein
VSYQKFLNLFRERNIFNAAVLLGLIFLVVILSLSTGSVDLSPHEIIQAFLREGDLNNQIIFWELRLPRLIASSCPEV